MIGYSQGGTTYHLRMWGLQFGDRRPHIRKRTDNSTVNDKIAIDYSEHFAYTEYRTHV